MSVVDYLTGLAVLLAAAFAVTCFAEAMRRTYFHHLRGSARVCGVGTLWTAAWVSIHLVPGVAGVLSRGTVLLAAGALYLAAVGLGVRRPAFRRPPLPRLGRLAWAGLAVALLPIVAYVVRSATEPVPLVDVMAFRGPGIARWLQSGSVWTNHEFIPFLPTGTYPQTGDVVFLSAILPWHDDAFLRWVDLPFVGLALVGTYALARELRATASTAALAAAALISITAVSSFASRDLSPDIVLYATFTIGVLFLLRALRGRSRAELVLAGTGLGLAFGTKWYGISCVAVAVAVWLLARFRGTRRLRGALADGVVLTGVVAAVGAVWLVRNWDVTGNPMFPMAIDALGFKAPANPVADAINLSIADRLADGRAWTESILPEWRAALGIPAALAFAAAIAVLVPGLRRRLGDEASPAAVLAAMCLGVTVAYFVTPASAQGGADRPIAGAVYANSRYVVPAIPLGLAVLARWIDGAGRRRVWLYGALLIAMVDAARHSFFLSVPQAVTLVGATILGMAALRLGGRRVYARRATLTLAAVAVAAIPAGYAVQKRFNAGRYLGAEPAVDWLVASAGSGHRVGIVGRYAQHGRLTSPILPAFGPRFENSVAYVGRDIGGFLEDYAGRLEFQAALHRDRFDVLLVGTAGAVDAQRVGWAEQAGFVVRARSRRLVALARPA